MIAALTYDPAFQMAQAQPQGVRTDAARRGMIGALDVWAAESPRFGANRKADGLGPIDTAVALVRANWVANLGASLANDAAVTALLDACADWLRERKFFGMRVTGWREQAIAQLHWQAAWAYCCDNYVQQAIALVAGNNLLGAASSIPTAVGVGTAVGSPYQFANSGYIHQALPQALLRGDTRDPQTIAASNGFQARNLGGRWTLQPWFSGNATGDTTSTTTGAALAIEAGPAAQALGSPVGPGPAWLAAALNNQRVRGYVYEMQLAPPAMSTRVATQNLGVEEVFLALPAAAINRWWAVINGRITVGPFPFPPGLAAPLVVNVSAARQLA